MITSVHQVWATDITYIPMPKGFFYVMAILDLHSRYVLQWQMSNTLEADWCIDTLRQSLRRWGKPQIFNTDQGSQITSLTKYFHYYNYQRPHQSLGYRTPAAVLIEGKEKQHISIN